MQSRAVQLALTAPTDGATVVVPKIDVLGNVAPDNGVVFVAGRRVRVTHGVFKSSLRLRTGTTRIKVEARASGYARTITWVNVRYRPVRVRPLRGGGSRASGLTAALRLAGLPTAGESTGAGFEAAVVRACVSDGGGRAYCVCTYRHLLAEGYNSVPKWEMLALRTRDALVSGEPSQIPLALRKAVVACIGLYGR